MLSDSQCDEYCGLSWVFDVRTWHNQTLPVDWEKYYG